MLSVVFSRITRRRTADAPTMMERNEISVILRSVVVAVHTHTPTHTVTLRIQFTIPLCPALPSSPLQLRCEQQGSNDAKQFPCFPFCANFAHFASPSSAAPSISLLLVKVAISRLPSTAIWFVERGKVKNERPKQASSSGVRLLRWRWWAR